MLFWCFTCAAPASTQQDCCVSKHHHNGGKKNKINGVGWILEHKPWPGLYHFHSADRQIASGTSKSKRPVLLTGSDSRSPRAIEIERHCPERFNKIAFHPQRWAPSHSHFASAEQHTLVIRLPESQNTERRIILLSQNNYSIGNGAFLGCSSNQDKCTSLCLPQDWQYFILQDSWRYASFSLGFALTLQTCFWSQKSQLPCQ